MPIHKRKKFTRQRGSKTHGWGSTKKHRGAGNRGGRGKAGTGKRADTKKPTIINLFGNNYFGKKGFKRPQKMIKGKITININQLNNFDKTDLNLKEMGYNKLLGKGKLIKKLNIIVPEFSKKAKEKIEKIGGTINASKQEK